MTFEIETPRKSVPRDSANAPPTAKLKPKEHGAYAILIIPIATSLAVAGPSVVGTCVAVAAVAGFLAHEPLLVILGHRGSRAKRGTPTASKCLTLLLALTVVGGCIALSAGSIAVQWSLLMCGVLAVSSFVLAVAGRHKTLGGQLWGIAGLSVPTVPILLAGGQTAAVALESWAAWLIGFSATTMAVRGVIAAQKRKSRTLQWLAITSLTVLLAGLADFGITLPIATLPMVVMSWYLMCDPPPAKKLKKVGWTLVSGTVASAIWMTVLSS